MTEHLKLRSQAISNVLANALSWVIESEEKDVVNNQLLKKDLKRSIAQCKRLENAVSSKMCIGVYGASQAGKSYLVSVLASHNTQPLTAVLGDEHVDFLRHINPAGGQESTGLVTRFTTDRQQTQPGFPIQTRLLSEMDLAKIFVNSFAQDILPSDEQDYDVLVQRATTQLDALAKEASTSSSISVEDVYELEDYCNSRFGAHPNMQLLKQIDFWERAAELLPKLSLVHRTTLLSLLWEEIHPITQLYQYLTAELARIGNPSKVYCQIEALMNKRDNKLERSERSIVNVSTLDALLNSDDTLIEIQTDQGHTSSIAVSVLSALTSELLIQLQHRPHPFFNHTDLLDFPGARSRTPTPNNVALLSQGPIQVSGFLRGKVAYLFDKFSADLQLTTMLLCVGPSNLEVAGLPRLVEDWIATTHGLLPAERKNLPTSLFLVLTKFDQELAQDPGKPADGSRWKTRLEASLLRPFGAHSHRTNWVNTWHPNRPFNNTFWLRNPNVDQFGLIEYEGEIAASPEIGFANERAPYLRDLKQAFLANDLVQKHFKEPIQAWNAAIKLNDGGMTYIVSGLSAVCQPDNKLKQIDERLSSIVEQRSLDLRKYFTSEDRDEVFKEKREISYDLLNFGAVLIGKQRLGEFIDFLLISDAETKEIFQRTQLSHARARSASKPQNFAKSTTSSKLSPIDDALAAILGIAKTQSPTTSRETPELTTSTSFSDQFVTNFLSEWESGLLAKASATNLGGYLHLDRALLQKLIHEVQRAAHRTGLVKHLKEVSQQNYQYRSSNTKSWVLNQTSIITSLFNEFLTHGALSYTHKSHQTTVEAFDGRSVEIFRQREAPTAELELDDQPTDYGKQYLLEWLQALQSSVHKNADFIAAQHGDTEANRKLGKILRKMDALKLTETTST
jgi:hypothetical protein